MGICIIMQNRFIHSGSVCSVLHSNMNTVSRHLIRIKMKCLERLKFANRDAATGMTTNRGVCVLNTHVHLRENHLRNKFASRNYRNSTDS